RLLILKISLTQITGQEHGCLCFPPVFKQPENWNRYRPLALTGAALYRASCLFAGGAGRHFEK
ncbi:MAG: hypothetical protein V4634_02375, partial [Pseudomonadota bacterium]